MSTRRKTWLRGAIALMVLGVLTAALLTSPVGAAGGLTKKKVKQIASKVVQGQTLYYRRGPVTANIPSPGLGFAGVDCPAGSLAVGGGGVVEQSNMLIESSYPSKGAAQLQAGFTGWNLFVRNNSGAPGDARAFVICVGFGKVDSNYAEGADPH